MSKYSKSDFITSCFLLNQTIRTLLIDRGWNFNYKNDNIISWELRDNNYFEEEIIFKINRDKFFHKDHDEIKKHKIFGGWLRNEVKMDSYLFEVLLGKFMDFLLDENNKHFLNKYYPLQHYNHKYAMNDTNVSKMIIIIGQFDTKIEPNFSKETHYQLTLREGKKGIGNKIKLHLDIDLFNPTTKNVDKNIKQYTFDKP